ncbi:MAG: nucleotide pyrophosphatase, partial [Candidatus Hydrogenedentes bacterium]|nr:nucleotide pyrophosphatase [Candidatus Hydrogenedentota bacterium]
APDLQLGFAEGYQADKEGAVGMAGPNLFSDNMDKWSGDHAASDTATTPGILFSNKALTKNAPHLVDISATALSYLGKIAPDDLEGEPLL